MADAFKELDASRIAVLKEGISTAYRKKARMEDRLRELADAWELEAQGTNALLLRCAEQLRTRLAER